MHFLHLNNQNYIYWVPFRRSLRLALQDLLKPIATNITCAFISQINSATVDCSGYGRSQSCQDPFDNSLWGKLLLNIRSLVVCSTRVNVNLLSYKDNNWSITLNYMRWRSVDSFLSMLKLLCALQCMKLQGGNWPISIGINFRKSQPRHFNCKRFQLIEIMLSLIFISADLSFISLNFLPLPRCSKFIILKHFRLCRCGSRIWSRGTSLWGRKLPMSTARVLGF